MDLKEVRYYDSYQKDGKGVTKKIAGFLEAIFQWLCDEVLIKHRISLDRSEWKVRLVPDTPQQDNGCDCGVFTIMCADFLMDNIPISESTLRQSDIPYFRQKILNDILRGMLNYPNIKL